MQNPYEAYVNRLPLSFTEDGRQRCLTVHQNALSVFGKKNKVAFNAQDAAFVINVLALMRKKDYRSSNPMGPLTEATGIFTEIAFSRFFNESASHFAEQFEANLGGDPGYERMLGRYRNDDKGTANKEKIFTFSKRAATSATAHIFTLATVEYGPDSSVVVTPEGWCWAADAKPWIRPHGGRYRVRLWVLKREGVLRPMSELLLLTAEV